MVTLVAFHAGELAYSRVVPEQQDLDPDGLLTLLRAWAGDARTRDAAAARTRERWLRLQAAEAATWLGTLVDLAERRQVVTLQVGATARTGRLVGVGHDLCVLDEAAGAVLVALPHVHALQAHPTRPIGPRGAGPTGAGATNAGTRPSTAGTSTAGTPADLVADGNRRPALELSFADALAALAAERSPVRLGLAAGADAVGTLVAVGADVVTLRGNAVARPVTFVPIVAVAVCAPTG